jgi:hypothetical protein
MVDSSNPKGWSCPWPMQFIVTRSCGLLDVARAQVAFVTQRGSCSPAWRAVDESCLPRRLVQRIALAGPQETGRRPLTASTDAMQTVRCIWAKRAKGMKMRLGWDHRLRRFKVCNVSRRDNEILFFRQRWRHFLPPA